MTAENEMGFPPPCLFILSQVTSAFFLSILSCFICCTFSPAIFLTISLLILSSAVIFNFTTKKQILGGSTFQGEVLSSDDLKHGLEMEVGVKIQPENSAAEPEMEYQEGASVDQMPNCIATSPDLSSDCESIDFSSTSEDSDANWSYPYNVGHFPACSDCSISDDESLFEIALPKTRYIVDSEDSKGIFWQDPLEFSPEFILRQHGLMELLPEINDMSEDDNMIEIDISVGSIKCSRVEIEA